MKSYNGNSHSTLMNSAPEDVKGTPVLQCELEKQSGYDERHKTAVNEKRMAKLRQDEAFRTLMPQVTWNRAGMPRWSEKVHNFSHTFEQDVVGTDEPPCPFGTHSPLRSAPGMLLCPASSSQGARFATRSPKPR